MNKIRVMSIIFTKAVIATLLLCYLMLGCSSQKTVSQILKDSSFKWTHIELRNFRVHCSQDQEHEAYIEQLKPVLESTLSEWLVHTGTSENDYNQIFDVFIMKEKEDIQRYTQEWIGHAELVANNGIILLQDSANGEFLKHQLYRLFLMNKYNGNQTNTFLNHPEYEWVQSDRERFTIYQKKGDFERANIDSLALHIEMTMDFNLNFLGITEYPHKMKLFFVGSRNDIQNLCGHAYGGQQIEWEHSMLMVDNSERPAATCHEMNHIFAYETWGEPKKRGFVPEGIAVASHNLCKSCGYTNHEITANHLKNGNLPTLTSLSNNFEAYDDMISYFTAGSFMYFLREKYGPMAFKVFWKEGVIEGAKKLGTSFSSLENEWLEVIKGTRPAGDEYYNLIVNSGCE